MSQWEDDLEESGLGKLPELEPLPELDDLLDEFDKEDFSSITEDSDRDNYSFEAPIVDEGKSPEEVGDISSDTSEGLFAEDFLISPEEPAKEELFAEDFVETSEVINDEGKSTELPYIDDEEYDSYGKDVAVHEVPSIEEDFSDSEDNEEDADMEDMEDMEYDENIGLPDMEFEDFQTIDEIAMNDPEFDKIHDEELLSEDEDDYEDEDGMPEEFKGNLLPGVNLDDEENPYKDEFEEHDDDKEDYEDEVEEPKESRKDRKNKPGFKELDEERVKEFFNGLLGKLKGLGRKVKGIKSNKDKSPKSPKKSNVSMDKTKMIYLGIGLAIVIALVVSYVMWGNSYKEVGAITDTVQLKDSDGKTDIELSKFVINEEGNLEVNLKNAGDISKDFSMYVNLKEKSAIPFMGSKFECESDIIAIEPGSEANEILTCTEGVNKELKYKVSTDLDEI